MNLNKNVGKYKNILEILSKCYQLNMNVNVVNEIMYDINNPCSHQCQLDSEPIVQIQLALQLYQFYFVN